jgi:uncharacterized protein (TIGR02678 family)
VHAEDVAPEDWSEVRRRFGEEARYCEEMFGLIVEARAEGGAAIDVSGGCTDMAFPAGGTVAHVALLLLDILRNQYREGASPGEIDAELATLVERYGRYWRRDAVTELERLRDEAIELLTAMGLITRDSGGRTRPRPAAARFMPDVVVADAAAVGASDPAVGAPDQQTLL